MQLYFIATMSPIPLALLGVDEARRMGIGYLRNFAGLVLGYAALSCLDLGSSASPFVSRWLRDP